jgi:hypothetical protein
MSLNLSFPLRRVCVPGIPSLLRPKNRPRVATITSAYFRVGNCSVGPGFLGEKHFRAWHSCSSENTVYGALGNSRPSFAR